MIWQGSSENASSATFKVKNLKRKKMITQSQLHKGLTVTYVPRECLKDGSPLISTTHRWEVGKVTSWNDRFVFVDYGSTQGKATYPSELFEGDLIKGDEKSQ
jgi:hypothetical protein